MRENLQPTCNQVATDTISRQAAIEVIMAQSGVVDKSVAKRVLAQLPSAQTDSGYIEQIKWERDLAIRQLADLGYGLGEKPRTQDYKTDHGYMWLCPKCGLTVHSDFKKCVRCGYER